ncbi:MAG: AAA family ATPase, partial [Muribaculaceae bacterium]|nr:AAA family ATPase [Muribaculaceae bacterium]
MGKDLLYPVDTANFRWIRENGFVYVDKTDFIDTMTREGKYYFLARPRRFGKSLFLDTLAEYFEGNRPLFKGLAIDTLQPGEWESFPILRFNLSGQIYDKKDILYSHLSSAVGRFEGKFGLTASEVNEPVPDRFYDLIRNLYKTTGKPVVVLVDEYDAPLVSTIDNRELQQVYREQLHGFYSVLKNAEPYVKFCLLTGVTRFGKVSVFSGLNNLKDITLSNDYAGICGITEEELYRYYDRGIEAWARDVGTDKSDIYQNLKFYYDGYHFSSKMLDIYNPFCINNVMADREYRDYWCRSGVPTILSKALMKNDFDVEK